MISLSRPVRARGLKPQNLDVNQRNAASRPVRARGLKPDIKGAVWVRN